MNTDTELMLGLLLAPELMDHYEALATPATAASAARRLEQFDHDVSSLRRLDEPAALEAALVLRRAAALQVAALPATSVVGMRRKARHLACLGDDPQTTWLIGPMIDAALDVDARRLGLPTDEQAAIRATIKRPRPKS